MTWVVGIPTVLAIVGGWLQVAGIWHPFGSGSTVAVGREHLALVEPTVTEDYVTSALAVGLGLVGIAIAWVLYGTRRARCRAGRSAADARAQVLVRRALRRGLLQAGRLRHDAPPPRVEEPLIGGSITGVTVGAREAGGALDAQTGYLRSYALAIAGAVAVLVVVFIGAMTTALIVLPLAAARRLAVAAARPARRRARARSPRSRRSCSG